MSPRPIRTYIGGVKTCARRVSAKHIRLQSEDVSPPDFVLELVQQTTCARSANESCTRACVHQGAPSSYISWLATGDILL